MNKPSIGKMFEGSVEKCEFCQTEIRDDEETRDVGGIEDSLTMCESCASHYLD